MRPEEIARQQVDDMLTASGLWCMIQMRMRRWNPIVRLLSVALLSWLEEQEQRRGVPFSPEQYEWLGRIRDVIANSLTIEREDFNYEPFLQLGGLGQSQ